MGTRTSLRKAGQPARPAHKRAGSPITDAERNLVAQVVLDQPGPLRPAQVTGLATALRRSKTAVKEMIEDAQDKFRANADFYVEMHRRSVEQAFEGRDSEVAMKGAQWAMERLTGEGARIIEPKAGEQTNNQGPRVMIGVRIGGLDATKDLSVTAIDVIPDKVE